MASPSLHLPPTSSSSFSLLTKVPFSAMPVMGGGRNTADFLDTEGGGQKRSDSEFLTALLSSGADEGPWGAALLTMIVVEAAFLSIVDEADPGICGGHEERYTVVFCAAGEEEGRELGSEGVGDGGGM